MPPIRSGSAVVTPALVLGALLLAGPVRAEGMVTLDEVVLTTTRTATALYDTLAGASVIGSDTLRSRFGNGPLTAALASLPGVSTQTTGDDPGVAINLRGLQDFGRVNVMVDGARQNFQKNGHAANGAFYLDTEMLKSVDITRGPSAATHGSGAVGGVVSFVTLDADDLITGEASRGGRLKFGYDTNGAGPLVHIAGASRLGERADLLVGVTRRRQADYRDGTGARVQSAQNLQSYLLKGRWRPADGHEATVSASRYANDFQNGARPTTVTTDTLTAGWHFAPGSDLWDLRAKLWSTRTRFDQRTAAGAHDRAFRVTTRGFDLANTARIATDGGEHALTFGADAFVDQVRTDSPLTPDGRRTAWGLFLQDQYTHGGWLEIIGALRHDGYRLTNSTLRVAGNRLSPKLTVAVTPDERVTLFATLAEGYRAPALTEALVEGQHPGEAVAGGDFFPNPALRPEVARTAEVGVNLRFADLWQTGDQLGARINVFRNDVSDYIDRVRLTQVSRNGYQYQNVASARISGLELEADYTSDRHFARLSGQVLQGKNRTTGRDLHKVPPWRISATLGLHNADQGWSAGTRATLVGARTDTELGFSGDRHLTVDLFGTWRFSDRGTAQVTLTNLFDRDYRQFLNANASPGRNVSASVSFTF